jgi:type IV pilus assembly protein PilC
MLEFNYKAKTKDGEIQTGVVEAENESAAAKVLTSKDLFPILVTTKETSSFSFMNHVPVKQKVVFIRQLATTITAGLPIAQAITMIKDQVSNENLKKILEQTNRDIEGGSSLSASLGRYPDTFSQVDITLIAAGETSGTLDKVLLRLADTTENDYKISRKMKSAFIYPGFVLVVVIGVVILMSVYVMPQMQGLFDSFNAQLPLITRIVIGISNAINNYGLILMVVLVAIIAGVYWYIRTPKGRYQRDSLIIKIPVIGGFLVEVYTSRLTHTLAGLVGSGVSLVDALSISAKAMGNKIYENSIKEASEKVKTGVALSTYINHDKLFDAMVPQMIKVGEETGELDKMLSNLADYFDDEVDNFVKSLSSIIEPVMIVVMGIFVAIILVAIMLPIYSVGQYIK